MHVKGEITGNEDLHIDGSVEGLIQLEDRKLTVGASAKVTADIIAREVVVYGNVKGNLRARDRIEIKKDGSVVGDLTTARIMIEDGAYFKGSIEIDKTGDASDSSFEKSSRRIRSLLAALRPPQLRLRINLPRILFVSGSPRWDPPRTTANELCPPGTPQSQMFLSNCVEGVRVDRD